MKRIHQVKRGVTGLLTGGGNRGKGNEGGGGGGASPTTGRPRSREGNENPVLSGNVAVLKEGDSILVLVVSKLGGRGRAPRTSSSVTVDSPGSGISTEDISVTVAKSETERLGWRVERVGAVVVLETFGKLLLEERMDVRKAGALLGRT